MQRRTFWLVAIVVIVIVAATVGGGVGGSLANKKTSSRQAITQRFVHHSPFTYFMLLLDFD
jgi:hypothetical protein